MVVGAALGILLTPRPGGESRQRLADGLRTWRDRRKVRLAHKKEQEEARTAEAS